MTNKSYEEITAYKKTMERLKYLLENNKKWKVEEIKYIEESEFVKEKVRVVIKDDDSTILYDIFTQYKMFDGYVWLNVKINVADIKKEIGKIIGGGKMKKFKKVDKETYKKFLKDYGEDKWEQNSFMGWCETYDFSLASGLYEIGTAERLNECMIARKYCDCPVEDWEYYILKENKNDK